MEQNSELKTKLQTYMAARFPERKNIGITHLDRMAGGTSSLSYSVNAAWQDENGDHSQDMVIRMLPELGALPPYDIRPQYEAINAAFSAGIPVPKVFWCETDPAIIGYPCFAMEKIAGEQMLYSYIAQPELHESLNRDYVECLVNIHNLDWKSQDFSVLKPPETDTHYAEKEIERWEWVISEMGYVAEPLLAEAIIWLKRNIPRATRTTLCHGDYYIHNIFCSDGKIAGIFDWELTAVGDPDSDVAWTLMFMDIIPIFWNEADFIKAYEDLSGVKISEESLYFWKLFGYVKCSAAALGGIRVGIDSENYDVHTLYIFNKILAQTMNSIAKMMNF